MTDSRGYRPNDAFAGLFRAFTGGDGSIGAELTDRMVQVSVGDPLLVSTASDIALFPGNGVAPSIESFRRSTRGFIELTAVSHVPLALAYLARLRELGGADEAVFEHLRDLAAHAERTRAANSATLWREQVALPAFVGIEAKIAALVEHTLTRSIAYAEAALANPSRLDWEVLQTEFLERRDEEREASMNDAMFATFCLAYIDIAYRIGNWLREQAIDWPRAMILVSGKSGRPTAGVGWASNNICNLIWHASDRMLPAERLYVAPHAPALSVAELPDASGLAVLEHTYRRIWCHTRASVEVSRRMFAGTGAGFTFEPERASDMPPITSADDRDVCIAQLRRIMEDPTQLLSNCVADYVVAELNRHGDQPERVVVPGFTNCDFPESR